MVKQRERALVQKRMAWLGLCGGKGCARRPIAGRFDATMVRMHPIVPNSTNGVLGARSKIEDFAGSRWPGEEGLSSEFDVQNVSQLRCKRRHRERLLQQDRIGFQDPVVHDRLVRISRHEQHPNVRDGSS